MKQFFLSGNYRASYFYNNLHICELPRLLELHLPRVDCLEMLAFHLQLLDASTICAFQTNALGGWPDCF